MIPSERRPWRLVFILYTAALTTGTHWPQLSLGPQMPTNDKMIHMVGFGGLAWLLWRTGWIRRRWVVALIALAWAGLDEFGQGLPGLGRTVSPDDMIANALGVLLAAAWMWALAPCGGSINRRRLALEAWAFDAAFHPWWRMATVAALGGQVVVAYLLSVLMIEDAGVGRRVVIASGAVGGVLAAGSVTIWWRAARGAARRRRPCFACSATDLTGEACESCGEKVTPQQWSVPTAPSRRAIMSVAGVPIVAAILVVAAFVGLLMVSGWVYALLLQSDPGTARVARVFGVLPPEFTGAIDLSLIMLLFAAFLGTYRRRLARFYDQSVRCRRCNHDLRGTPAPDGAGQCSECGTSFFRTAEE